MPHFKSGTVNIRSVYCHSTLPHLRETQPMAKNYVSWITIAALESSMRRYGQSLLTLWCWRIQDKAYSPTLRWDLCDLTLVIRKSPPSLKVLPIAVWILVVEKHQIIFDPDVIFHDEAILWTNPYLYHPHSHQLLKEDFCFCIYIFVICVNV